MNKRIIPSLFIAGLTTISFAASAIATQALSLGTDQGASSVNLYLTENGAERTLRNGVAEGGSDRVGADRLAEGGAERILRNRIAEDGADRIGANRLAEGGAERTLRDRVAEDGSDRIGANKLAENGSERTRTHRSA